MGCPQARRAARTASAAGRSHDGDLHCRVSGVRSAQRFGQGCGVAGVERQEMRVHAQRHVVGLLVGSQQAASNLVSRSSVRRIGEFFVVDGPSPMHCASSASGALWKRA